jgi:hypothetical protein
MFTYRENLRSRIRRLPNWLFVALIGMLGAGLLLLLLLGTPPTPTLPSGSNPSLSPSPTAIAPTLTPYVGPSADDTLQPSYVAPLPSATSKTFIRVNQLSVRPTSATDKSAPLILSVFVSEVLGSDLGTGGLAFSLTLKDGSATTGQARSGSTGDSYWVDFTIPAGSASGTLTVLAQANASVLLRQALAWPVP